MKFIMFHLLCFASSQDIEVSFCKGLFHFGADWFYLKVEQDNLFVGTYVDNFPDPDLKIVFLDWEYLFNTTRKAI